MHVKSERQSNFFNVCSPCRGNCCKNAKPPLTLRRKQIIEAYLQEQKIPIKNPFVHASYMFPKEEETEGYCIFYDKTTGKCQIHSVKPETCVAGPITFDINMKTKKIEWHLKTEKICTLAGELYRNKDALREHLESAKKEILRLVHELDSEALRTILKIEEPETFKVDEYKVENDVLHKLTSNL